MNEDRINNYIKTQLEYDHHDDIQSTNSQAMMKITHDMIVNTVKEYSKNNKVHLLDVGCGWGDFSNKLDPFLEDYIGVEPSHNELKRFSKSLKKNNRYLVRGFGENLDFLKDNSRNVILLISVLDHCYDWERTINNCKRVLAPDGIMIIAMENSEKFVVKIKKSFGLNIEHHGHLFYLSGSDLKNKFSDYRVIKSRSTGYLFGFHYVTKLLPIPKAVMVFINRIFDFFMRFLLPNMGHMLFFVFKSKPETSAEINYSSSFVCPLCLNEFTFHNSSCGECGKEFLYPFDNVLDSIDFDKKKYK